MGNLAAICTKYGIQLHAQLGVTTSRMIWTDNTQVKSKKHVLHINSIVTLEIGALLKTITIYVTCIQFNILNSKYIKHNIHVAFIVQSFGYERSSHIRKSHV